MGLLLSSQNVLALQYLLLGGPKQNSDLLLSAIYSEFCFLDFEEKEHLRCLFPERKGANLRQRLMN